MSSELQSPSELVPKILKAWNAAVVILLTGWGFMVSPALRMPAASPDISAINSILKRLLTRIGLPSILEAVGLTRYRRSDGFV